MKFYPWILAAVFSVLLPACEKSADTTSLEPKPVVVPSDLASRAPRGRLPELALPLAYDLDLRMDPRTEGFSGTARITIQLKQGSDIIWLHGKDLQVEKVQAVLADGSRLTGDYEQVLDSGVSAVIFPQIIAAGELLLELTYGASFDRNLTGLFKVEEQGEVYVLAKSESIQARRYLPGFDEPGLKASYQFKLTVPAGYQVITNSPELSRVAADGGMETVTFARTRPMSTYLLSLAVGPFDVVERPPLPANEFRDQPIPLRGFSRKGRGADMSYILDITPRMMEIFEQELKRPYPFAKLDIVAAPQWPSGATELTAAITYREERILVGDQPAPGARLALIDVHAHELAHMWFGNLVTPPWWDDLWLKEGFATWGTPLVLTIMEPDGGHDVTAVAQSIRAMRLDSLASTRAIREPIADNNNIRNAYDAITYLKSLGVIHMVDQYFGPEIFRPALGRYIEKFADGEADSPQFYEVIGMETNTPALTETFRSFVEQKGVPLVTTTLNCDKDKPLVSLEQQRYKPLGSAIDAQAYHWTIPLCIRTSEGERHCALIDKLDQDIELTGTSCPRWVFPNAGGSGYYRWNMPEQQWRALLTDFDDFAPTEALSIVDSALAAFEAGKLSAEIFWQLIEVSSRSTQRQVVTAPLAYLTRYFAHYFSSDERAILAEKLSGWYQPVLARALTSEDAEMQILYAEIITFLAVVMENPEARQTLHDKAVAFTGFQGPREVEALSSDLYESALTVAVQDLGGDFVEHLIVMREQLDDPKFASASASALGRVTDPSLLPRVRELALSDTFGPRETLSLLMSATSTRQTGLDNWQWVSNNFEQIIGLIPGQRRRQTPMFALALCSQEGMDQLRKLFARHGDLAPGHQRSLAQTEEGLQLCMAMTGQAEKLALPQ